jgi:hypothetical protein
MRLRPFGVGAENKKATIMQITKLYPLRPLNALSRAKRVLLRGMLSRFRPDGVPEQLPLAVGTAPDTGNLEVSWYLARNPDVMAAGFGARQHYEQFGKAEGRSWGLPDKEELDWQASAYLQQNPDVAEAGVDPLGHYLRIGATEGRTWPVFRLTPDERAADELPWVHILRLNVKPALTNFPALNVLLPSLAMVSMSGGPNTAINIACRLAAIGIKIRLMSVSEEHDPELSAFWAHAASLTGIDPRKHGVEVVDASRDLGAINIGGNDLFMATAWWTAQAAKYALRHTVHARFFYLIQDYEPLLHPASTQQALAEETYSLDYLPIINSQLLYDFLVKRGVGRFKDPSFAAKALVFEPAVDRQLFFSVPEDIHEPRRKRLLFYARPTTGLRNLFELGVAALRTLISTGAIDHKAWDFCAIGEAILPVPLGSGAMLQPLPWRDLSGYARQMRESDVLLSLMLSPHPSYPPLEMAACGRPVVTTTFANKDQARLRTISPNIIGVEPTLEGIAEGLLLAMRRGTGEAMAQLPSTWAESLGGIVPRLYDAVLELRAAPASSQQRDIRWSPPTLPYPEQHAAELMARRVSPGSESADLSVLTAVYAGSDPTLFRATAASLLAQTRPFREWVLLAQGPIPPALEEALHELRQDERVRILRRPTNIGIIRGMRICLEEARGRFVTPLDGDDLLTNDAVHFLAKALEEGAEFAFSDEDVVCEKELQSPIHRSRFDPILNDADSTIWHLCGFERTRALELGVFSDDGAEACQDWDTVQRFGVAGAKLQHVPHVLYHWRHHAASLSASGALNDATIRSVRHVLSGIIARQRKPELYEVQPYPLFRGVEQLALLRRRIAPLPFCLVYIVRGEHPTKPPNAILSALPVQESCVLRPDRTMDTVSAAALETALRDVTSEHLVVLDEQLHPNNDHGPWDAMRMFEMHNDVAAVGGRILDAEGLVAACAETLAGPDMAQQWLGRARRDPGPLALAFKPQTATRIAEGYFFCRTDILRAALSEGGECPWQHLAQRLAEAANSRGLTLAYSPLVEAEYYGQRSVAGSN